MRVELGNISQSWQLMQIPTNSKDKIEQAEVHFDLTVNVEVSIYLFFSEEENNNIKWQLCGN